MGKHLRLNQPHSRQCDIRSQTRLPYSGSRSRRIGHSVARYAVVYTPIPSQNPLQPLRLSPVRVKLAVQYQWRKPEKLRRGKRSTGLIRRHCRWAPSCRWRLITHWNAGIQSGSARFRQEATKSVPKHPAEIAVAVQAQAETGV